MKDGKIIEEGNHKDLIDKQGEYYKLINNQDKGYGNSHSRIYAGV